MNTLRVMLVCLPMVMLGGVANAESRQLELLSDGFDITAVRRVHRRLDYHCHRRYGYRRWCHQGAWDWRDDARDYGRPYYRRENWRRRYWRRDYNRRRYDRDRPYWRRHPERPGPSIYNAL